MVTKHTLSVQERLKSKVLIEKIFREGKSKASAPLRLVYLETASTKNQQEPIQIMVSVSKRLFPKAVDRNAIKRQLREAYRKQKHLLTPVKPKLTDRHLALALLFIEKQQVEHRIILDHLTLLLEQLVSDYG